MKKISTTIIIGSFLLLNGCGSAKITEKEGGYYHSAIYFGQNLAPLYKKGVRDGCTTSKGDYKKSHVLFKNSSEYNDGWFMGRNKCRHLLIVDKD